MSNNKNEKEKGVNTVKEYVLRVKKSKLLRILLSIVLILYFLVGFLKVVLKADTADKTGKINEFIEKRECIEYKLC